MTSLTLCPDPFGIERRDDRGDPTAARGHEGDLAVHGRVQDIGQRLAQIGCTDLGRTVLCHTERLAYVLAGTVLYKSVAYGTEGRRT